MFLGMSESIYALSADYAVKVRIENVAEPCQQRLGCLGFRSPVDHLHSDIGDSTLPN